MQEDERRVLVETRQGIAGGQREAEWRRRVGPDELRQLKITFHRVLAAIYPRRFLVKKTRTLPRITQAVKFTCSGDAPNHRAPQQPLEIERQIRLQAAGFH